MSGKPEAVARPPELQIAIGPPDLWQIVKVGGELDLATAPTLEEHITALITTRSTPRIALELAQLSFCDSSGLNMLIRLWKRIVAAGGQLVLLRPAGRVTRALETTGLDRFLRVMPSLPESPALERA